MSNQLEKVKELIELRAKARLGGGEKAIEKQHAKGKRWRKSHRETTRKREIYSTRTHLHAT